MLKAVLIDLDGTLIHTAPEIAWAANRMLTTLGKPMLTQAQIETYIGEGASALIKRCLTGQLDGEPDADLFDQAQTLFAEYYAQVAAQSQPYPEVRASLQALRNAGYALACVTNKPARFTLPLLEHSHLSSYFDCVVSGDTLERKKPDPAPIFYICEKLGVHTQEAVLIGDSKTDIMAARNAGCYVFTVSYGYNQGCKAELNQADAHIHHLMEALDLIH